MSGMALRPWLDHPLAEDLLRFNLLAADLMHPSRLAQVLPEPVGGWMADPDTSPLEASCLQRHAASDLLQRLALPLVDSLDHAVLPVAMAPPELFERLVQCCGLALLGPAIRRVITRADVAQLESSLQPWGLDFARRSAPRCWPGTEAAVALAPEQADGQAGELGAAVLEMAFDHAPPAVAQRARLRLPPPAQSAREHVEAALGGADAMAASDLALRVLQELDSSWLSSFPAHH